MLDHPNGALELVEVMLCAAAADLEAVQARYQTYLDRPASSDRMFDVNGAHLALVSPTDLDALLPGERRSALPAIAAYAVAVVDLARTTDFLRRMAVPHRPTTRGDVYVPADSALGAAIVFRQRMGG